MVDAGKNSALLCRLHCSLTVGELLRQLTKHKSHKIKALVSDVVDLWKNIIVKGTTKNIKNGSVGNKDSVKAGPKCARSSSVKVEQGPFTENGN
ncbi:transcription elongation factor TFIIS [Olea europaea subsp. europaea]|uniref:Transcription elongation factor TFIIS n=1 Tax=Olea europaea subsp. europaea TaxID=158383 RepID=A0A8S0VNJ9_OLEEU|nr:transcription elongation factor TFIIS [Olea europaea subsp. europaea]